MGRPQQYATPAARQAACRPRRRATTVVVDRRELDQIALGWHQCQEAVAPLARRGDPLAARLYRASLGSGLAVLAAWFRDQAAEDEAR